MSRMFALNILLLPLHLFLHTVMQLFGRYLEANVASVSPGSTYFFLHLFHDPLEMSLHSVYSVILMVCSVHTASYCTSVRPRRGIPPLWLFPSFLSFSSLESRTEAVVFVQIVKPIKDYVICYYINEIDLTWAKVAHFYQFYRQLDKKNLWLSEKCWISEYTAHTYM